MSDPRPCEATWTTTETVTSQDAHKWSHSMRVQVIHKCMFVVGSYHPKHHECSAGKRCGSYIRVEEDDE